jgi:hypothetical protein
MQFGAKDSLGLIPFIYAMSSLLKLFAKIRGNAFQEEVNITFLIKLEKNVSDI